MNSIPQGWEIKTLGEVCEINPKNKLDDDLEVSFIPMNLIADKYQNKFSYEIRKWSEVKKGYTHLQNHCIAIAKITPCFENGKCVILQDLKNGYGAGTTELIVVLADKNKILQKFIFYFFNTTSFTKEGVKNFKGTAGQLRISKDFITNLQIPLPPLEVQKAIVEKLENAFAHIDEAVRHLKSVQTNIPRLKSSLLHCAFSGKLTESQITAPTSTLSFSQRKSNPSPLPLTKEMFPFFCTKGEPTHSPLLAKNRAGGTTAPAFSDFSHHEVGAENAESLRDISASPQYDKEDNLPQGWEVKALGEIFLIERGGSPRPIKEYLTTDSDGINWIKIGDTKNITKYITTTAQKIKPEGKKTFAICRGWRFDIIQLNEFWKTIYYENDRLHS